MKLNPFNTKIGLALGGGAARGIAHIGVLKAFEEENIEISYISGTSVGALVAAFYAFGKKPDEIMEIGKVLSISKVANFTFRKKGFFTTDSIEELVLEHLGDRNIEDAIIPLAIVAADITSGEEIIFKKGPLAKALCASIAVPGIYVPVEINNRFLVDGGIVENVPISPLEKMGAGIIVGVDLNGVTHYPAPTDIFGVMGNAFDIAIDLRTRDQLKECDVKISLDLSQYSRLDNSKVAMQLFEEGYLPTKKKIRKLLWYKRTNLIQYSLKVLRELIPLKVPLFLKKYFGKGQEKISVDE